MAQLLFVHAVAVVGHAQADLLAAALRIDADLAAFAVVLDGIAEQVEQNLTQPHGIGHHEQVGHFAAHRDAARVELRSEQRQRAGHQRGKRHGLQIDPQLAALQARQIEHIVDQAEQMLAGRTDVFEPAPALHRSGIGCLFVGQQQLRKSQHGVQWRAQLMAHAGQKAALGLALAQRHLAFVARLLRCALVGHVPVHADASARAVFRVDEVHRP